MFSSAHALESLQTPPNTSWQTADLTTDIAPLTPAITPTTALDSSPCTLNTAEPVKGILSRRATPCHLSFDKSVSSIYPSPASLTQDAVLFSSDNIHDAYDGDSSSALSSPLSSALSTPSIFRNLDFGFTPDQAGTRTTVSPSTSDYARKPPKLPFTVSEALKPRRSTRLYKPTPWTCFQLRQFASSVQQSFDFDGFEAATGKCKNEVLEAFDLLLFNPINNRYAGNGDDVAEEFERELSKLREEEDNSGSKEPEAQIKVNVENFWENINAIRTIVWDLEEWRTVKSRKKLFHRTRKSAKKSKIEGPSMGEAEKAVRLKLGLDVDCSQGKGKGLGALRKKRAWRKGRRHYQELLLARARAVDDQTRKARKVT